MKRNKSVWMIFLILALLVANMLLNGTFSQKQEEDHYVVTGEEGTLEVHFIDVGQGDAALIFQGEHAMLIDGGDNLQGWNVLDYLNYMEIKYLDYVIATHPDADHIGGLDTVLKHISCSQMLMPEYERNTGSYEGLMEVVDEKQIEVISPQPGEIYSLGTAEFTILAPNGSFENVNDNSIAFRMVHGKNSFLFTGDAESDAETEMIKSGRLLASDVYKVAHHGSASANTELFLKAVKPSYAVISCGAGNDYGHPHSEVLNQLRRMGIKVFRTDEQGTIVAVSDAEQITWNTVPTESWQSGQ